MYVRYTTTKNPMSDLGHTMFVIGEKENKVSGGTYGNYKWTFDGKNAVNINTLKDEIITAWGNTDFDNFVYDLSYWANLSGADVFNSFNPNDIVDSAENWDSMELVAWIWQYVLEPNDIQAVITNDGCILFDEDLIR